MSKMQGSYTAMITPMNGDGSVDAVDAQLILNYYVQNNIAGIPTEWEDLIKHEK